MEKNNQDDATEEPTEESAPPDAAAASDSDSEDNAASPYPKRRRTDDGGDDGDDDNLDSPPPLDVSKFQGKVVFFDSDEYDQSRHQYATSGKYSGQVMNPSVIIYPKLTEDHKDIKNAIEYAATNNLAIAVRSGGHQYLGFSSTYGHNIQIDMSNYKQWDASNVSKSKGSTLVLGPAWKLSQLHEKCKQLKIFFPHGECAGVAIGGHCQTGGYSLFSHSFGMFIDYIVWFELITADQQVRTITRPNPDNPNSPNDDLWFSVLGGSPGNFGIVVRLCIEVKHDNDYPNSKALFRFLNMRKDTIEKLLDVFANTNDDKNLSYNIEYSVMVLSKGALHRYKFELDGAATDDGSQKDDTLIQKIEKLLPGFIRNNIMPALIIVMAADTGVDTSDKGTKTSQEWFDNVCDVVGEIEKRTETPHTKIINAFMGLTGKSNTPLSELDYKCSWRFDREFRLPFQKRVFHGSAQNLVERGFAKWAAEKCWELEGRNQEVMGTDLEESIGLKLGCQFITGGCNGSKQGPLPPEKQHLRTALGNRNPHASMAAFDYFYRTRTKEGGIWDRPFEEGKEWLDTNEESVSKTATGNHGRDGKFTDKELRFLYAPWGPKDQPWSSDVNLDSEEMIGYFYTNREDYERCLKTKTSVDKNHVFTPNSFCVGYDTMDKDIESRRRRPLPSPSRLPKKRRRLMMATAGAKEETPAPVAEAAAAKPPPTEEDEYKNFLTQSGWIKCMVHEEDKTELARLMEEMESTEESDEPAE